MAPGTVGIDQFVSWLSRFRELVTEQQSYLTDLDSAIGDADHGANMTRGMNAVMEKRQEILDLAAAFVEHPVARPDAPKIQAQRAIADCDKGFGQGLDDLVVERAAVKRVGVGKQGHATTRLTGIVDRDLDPARRTFDRQTLDGRRFQMRSRSTTRP